MPVVRYSDTLATQEWSTDKALPRGMRLDSKTGQITGSPTEEGAGGAAGTKYTITVTFTLKGNSPGGATVTPPTPFYSRPFTVILGAPDSFAFEGFQSGDVKTWYVRRCMRYYVRHRHSYKRTSSSTTYCITIATKF